jgi:SAM-dependent methyltransferase
MGTGQKEGACALNGTTPALLPNGAGPRNPPGYDPYCRSWGRRSHPFLGSASLGRRLFMPGVKSHRPTRRTVGLSSTDRAMWTRLYAKTSIQELPWFSPTPYPPLVRAVEAGWLKPPGPVLDVGCGLGSNVLWLTTQGFQTTGIDIAPGAVEAAESRRTASDSDATFLVDDVLASRLPTGRFRGAIDSGCFHTLPVRRRSDYAASLARVLRPGATLLLFWVAREETGSWGPPHRLSVKEVVDTFESRFLVEQIEFRPRKIRLTPPTRGSTRPLTTLAGYTARLARRSGRQPPPQ